MSFKQLKYGVCVVLSIVVSSRSFAGIKADSISYFSNPQKFNYVLKTNLLPMLWGAIPFTAEYRLVAEATTARWQSTQIAVSYLGKSPILQAIESSGRNGSRGRNAVSFHVSGVRFQIEHRFYLRHTYNYAPKGSYIALLSTFAQATFKLDGHEENYIQGTNWDISILYGKQIIRRRGFVFDFFAGLGYKNNIVTQHWSKNIRPINTRSLRSIGYFSDVKLTLGFNMGYAF